MPKHAYPVCTDHGVQFLLFACLWHDTRQICVHLSVGFLPVASNVVAEVFVADAVVVMLVSLVFAFDGGMLVVAEFTGFLKHLSIRGTAIFDPFLLKYKM